jgi:hypothetical protein
MADYRKRIDPPAQYKNMFGDRSEKPLSVQMAEVGVEFTPAGTIFGLNDIKEELQKEEPDYYKIGMMAGVEAIGLIPGLDKVAIEAIKAGAKKVGLDKVADQTDVLLGGPKAEDSVKTEIIAGPGAKSYSDASLLRAGRLEASGASPAQIEAETGRVKTGTPEDYLDNKGKTLAGISPEYKNLVGIRDHLQGLIKQISTENSSSAASEIARYERELAEINQRIAKIERANPADKSGIVVKPQNPFKFEIDDSRIEIKNSDGAQTLKESTKHYPMIVRNIIPTHTELFNEYPNLEYVEFYVDPNLGNGAHFDPTISRQGAIVVGPKYPGLGSPNGKKFRKMFFHELQHATQHQDFKIAGLEQLGGSPMGYGQTSVRPDSFYKGREVLELLEQNPNLVRLRDEILEIFEAQRGTGALDAKSPGLTFPGMSPNPDKVFGDAGVAKKMARKMRELESELFKVYMKTASETEARLAGRRAQDIATVGSGPKPRVTSDLAKERRIETKEEYWDDTPKSDADKKKQDIKLKLGAMTNEEVLRYATGAINFARYAKGIDKELMGFNSHSVTKTNYSPSSDIGFTPKKDSTLEDFGYYVDNPAKWGNTDWAKNKQASAEKYAKEGGKSAQKLLSGPQTAFLGIDNKKPLYLDTKFLSTLKGANDEVTDMSNPKYVDLKKSVEEEGFVPDQKGNKIMVGINHKGEAFIMEGNNRVAIAKEFGAPSVKAEVRYYNGAEEVDGPYSPQNILKYASQAPRQFAEGGTVDMNQQMSFAFEDGGLRDDGMMRDPVSGNEVPPGSTAKEVRDDIPAQLSEGEYVVPADVVRYYGVKFFEDLRDNAKMGLQDMEARGRIGGEPVPAGGPMNDDDLSPEELAAIQEMMGMAEGGVVNMYKQQQDLYSAPKQAVGNPTANMNQGGTVAGYQPGGSVATDQDFLQAGQQARQRSFAGFPLGATIFPSAQTGQTVLGPEGTQVATTDAIGGGTTGGTATDDSALVTVTLYGPNGEIRTLTLPTDQAIYDQLIAQGWSTEMPIAGATSDNDDGGDAEVETDPNAWMNKFSYDDFGKLATQTSETLTKIPFGGVIGLLGNGTKAAQAAANIIVMKANGYDTAELEKELTKFRKETGLNLLPNELTNGDQLAKDIMLKNTMLASSNATDLKNKPLFTDDQDFRDYMSKVLPETVSSPGLSGATAESATEVAKEQVVMSQPVKPVIKPSSNNDDNDVPSHAEIMERHYGTSWKDDRTSAQKEASDVGFGSDTGGWKPAGFDWNKGGLMATPKPKKKTRKYNKGGLAGKK